MVSLFSYQKIVQMMILKMEKLKLQHSQENQLVLQLGYLLLYSLYLDFYLLVNLV